MRRLSFLALALCLAFQTGETSAEETASPETLIAQLGSENYAEREKASAELWKLGDAGMALLRKAAEGDDPEVATRVRQLIRRIDLGIQPDSPQPVIDLVMAYDKGGPAERRRILEALRGMRAYRQILKLYATEKDESYLPMLSSSVEGVALEAARQSLAAEPSNPAEALAFLTMARPGPTEWMAVASIHRSLGDLDEELKRAAGDQSADGPVRRYTLLAAAGRIPEAAKAAEEAGLHEAGWRLLAYGGDPLPWIRSAGTGEDDSPAEGLNDYRDWVVDLWTNGESSSRFATRFLSMANSNDEDRQSAGIYYLFLTREDASAEKILRKQRPMEAFAYFEALERIDEAIACLGLDPQKPDFAAWVKERFDAIAEKPDDSDSEEQELRTVGGFMAEHGMAKELQEAFGPPLEHLMESEESRFLQLSSRFFGGNEDEEGTITGRQRIVRPIFELLPKSCKEEDARWLEALQEILGARSAGPALWTWLGELEPSLDRLQRTNRMAELLGYLPDREHAMRGFLIRAWDSLPKVKAADETARMNVLAQVSIRSGDPHDYARVVDTVLEKGLDRSDFQQRQRLYLSLTGDWKKAAESWAKMVKESPANPVARAYLAACLRHTGDAEGAAREEQMASRLCLGEPQTEFYCVQAFQYGGEFERASRWLRQAYLDNTQENSSSSIEEYLAQDALESADWKLAASLNEALAFERIRHGTGPNGSVTALNLRIRADVAFGLSRVKSEPEKALKTLRSVQDSKVGPGVLADYFFPGLRAAGLTKEHDEWFEKSWQEAQPLIARFPDADNMLNSISWGASRANRHLDQAEAFMKHALELWPDEPNYLDTMGEISFARRDRAKAMEWSARANGLSPLRSSLMQQYQRFEKGDFPPP